MPDTPSSAALAARRRRIAAGEQAALTEAATTHPPRRSQLMLPLLDELAAQGGRARPRDLYDRVAERLGLDPTAARSETVTLADGRVVPVFDRAVRWTRQTALAQGFILSPERGIWELSRPGNNALRNCRPGVIVTVFETARGHAFWAHAEDAAALIAPSSLDLILTLPPYPILKGKDYGTHDPAAWLTWMTDLAGLWKPPRRPRPEFLPGTFRPGPLRPARLPPCWAPVLVQPDQDAGAASLGLHPPCPPQG